VEYLSFLSVNFEILRSRVSIFIIIFEVFFIASPFSQIFPFLVSPGDPSNPFRDFSPGDANASDFVD